jgi:hypothetical protein
MHSPASATLRDFGFFTTQAREHGVVATATAIEFILNRLPARNRWCVEFGAWDGLVGSTSRRLILDCDYAAVLIEGNHERFAELQKKLRRP